MEPNPERPQDPAAALAQMTAALVFAEDELQRIYRPIGGWLLKLQGHDVHSDLEDAVVVHRTVYQVGKRLRQTIDDLDLR